MNFNVGFSPLETLLILTLMLAILGDFLLELFSVRMSLSTARFQAWLFDHFGQSLLGDFLIAILFQGVSFRKKAFWVQISSLVNVGSFNRRQILILSFASLIGVGLSFLPILLGSLTIGVILCVLAFILSLLAKDQIKDFAVATLALGIFLIAIQLFSQLLGQSSLNIHMYQLQPPAVFAAVLFTTLFFRTPLAFLFIIAIIHAFIGINLVWFPVLFFVHSLASLIPFYRLVLKGKKRLYLFLGTTGIAQVLQLGVTLVLISLFSSQLESLEFKLRGTEFFWNFKLVVLFYIVYNSLSLIVVSPLIFMLSHLPFFKQEAEDKKESQKILYHDGRGSVFSIHLSLFLLRQEFKKFTTSVHTIVKMCREVDPDEEALNQKFVRYQAILNRVGDEIKELCFGVGRQRAYRWQVREIMSYYRYVNQLELLVEDLASVARILRTENFDEELQRECRFWLGMQLKMFESFLNFVLGVGKDNPEKMRVHLEKSYEILERFKGGSQAGKAPKDLAKKFYRISESIGNLAT